MLAQTSQVADMVDVRVRMNEKLGVPAATAQATDDFVDAIAAVDDDRVAAVLVDQNRAVAGERTDRERL